MTTRFAIVGVQRTGTTLIRTTLDDHPSILALGEIFLYSHGRFPFRRRAGADVVQSYRSYIEQSPRRRLMHFLNRTRIIHEFLNHTYSQPGFDAIGFKLMLTQAEQFPMVVRFLLEEKISVIHVIRRNVLKTHISRETARHRKLFHAKTKIAAQAIPLNTRSLVRSLAKISRDNDHWTRTFARSRYLRVDYESFVADRNTELEKLFAFLCVPPELSISSSLVKVNPDAIADVLANYDEVRVMLQGTPFASCLAE
jgi:hypothetical protein